jgi:hypothetical protein
MLDSTAEKSPNLKIVGPSTRFPKVGLIEPTRSGYLLLALEIDHRPPFAYFLKSARKRLAIEQLRALGQQLRARSDVVESTIFNALLSPPGRGEFLRKRPHVKVARFDLVLLVEFRSLENARTFARSKIWLSKTEELTKLARGSISLTAENERRIGPVDHAKQGVFLFNYFYADHLQQNVQVWEYTAGWFQQETGLDNSVLLLPDRHEGVDYKIINHCRWDRLSDILPSLLFKPSFRSFVLANFAANATAAIPVLYRRM